MASNIERFNQYAGHFLAKLYESFPQPCTLDCVEAVKGTELAEPINDKLLQEATTDPEVRFCSDALKWLLSTGYFTGDQRLHCVQVARAVLTPKGFEALNAVPDALRASAPLGERLSHLAAEGSKEATKAAIGEVVGQVIGVAARQLFST
jgi:hypothetical protein